MPGNSDDLDLEKIAAVPNESASSGENSDVMMGSISPTNMHSNNNSRSAFLRNKRHLLLFVGVSLLMTGFVDWSTLFAPNSSDQSTTRTAERSFHGNDKLKKRKKGGTRSSLPQQHVPSKKEWRDSTSNGGGTIVNVRNVASQGSEDNDDSESSEDVSTVTTTPFPVINDENKIPGIMNNGQPLPAAEALDCRESVVAFVINATDARDECDGLRKAFDKTCNTDSAQDIIEGKHSDGTSSVPQRRQRRRLVEKFSTDSVNERTAASSRRWKYHTYKFSRSLRTFTQYLVGRTTQGFFFAEDAIIDEWEDAKYLVQNDLDRNLVHESPVSKQRYHRHHHHYAQSQHQSRELRRRTSTTTETIVVGSHSNKTTSLPKNPTTKTTTVTAGASTIEHKPMASLTLPTASEHVSGKVLSDTVMLQQQETVIAEAMERSGHNSTNSTTTTEQQPLKEAAVDAVRSSNAVAEANAAVSAVLNDPTSVEARTCCASILNVFHENCDFPSGEEVSDRRLIIVIFVIAFCGMVKSLIRHFRIRWLPEAAGCILVGVVGGGIMTFVPHYDLSFDGNWFLRIMVPPIVFEAALSIDKKAFNRHIVPISFFSVVGTLMASAITAIVVYRGTAFLNSWGLCSTIPFIESLTFGALISSIDPIAVLSVLSNIGMSDTDTIYVVIFGESLLNDGVAIVLFQTLVHFLDESLIIDGEAVFAGAMHFLVVALGSLFVGIASGATCTVYYWAMHGCHTPLVEVLMFFCWAFIPYYICDGIEWSGIVAVVATGFVMDLFVVGQDGDTIQTGAQTPPASNVTHQESLGSLSQSKQERRRLLRKIFSNEGHLSAISRTHVGFVTEILSTMMETAIFAYLGLFLFSYRYHWNLWHSVIAILACCVGRGIMIPCMSFFANRVTTLQQMRNNCKPRFHGQHLNGFSSVVNKPPGVVMDSRMQLVLFFAGLRGAMSFALVEHIPLYDTVTGEGSRLKPELKAMTSAAIIFTVFVMGGYTSYLMERLGLAPGSSASDSTEMVGLLRNSAGKETSPTPSFDINDVAPLADTFRARKKGISDTQSINSI